MARARKKKSPRARRRPVRRAAKRRKVMEAQASSGWTLGAGFLALAILLGAGVYMVATNDQARTTVAGLVGQIEMPQMLTDNAPASVSNESAPAR